MRGAVQDPDKFIEQADQEQQGLRRRLEGATERVTSIQAWFCYHISASCLMASHKAAVCLVCASCGAPLKCTRLLKQALLSRMPHRLP